MSFDHLTNILGSLSASESSLNLELTCAPLGISRLQGRSLPPTLHIC